MSREAIPKKVFVAVLVLLLLLSLSISVTSSFRMTYCNKDTCPKRFDIFTALPIFVLMASLSIGVASLAHLASKKMVKAIWPSTKL